MAVPTYDQFIDPILAFLASKPEGSGRDELYDSVAGALRISPDDRQLMLPSGNQFVYKNRIGWALDRIKRAGLAVNPRRGHWTLNADGAAFVRDHPGSKRVLVMERAAEFLRTPLAAGAVPVRAPGPVNTVATPAAPALSPDERLDQALVEIREGVSASLRDELSRVSPAYFEKVVLDLLYRLGYGTSREALQQVGGTGDGGIDGVISLDRLGLEKVYVQAKRWQNTVGRPEIQAFYGAVVGQRAKKGVFITTSGYTAQAVEYVRSVEGIVLVDGGRLAELMIEHELGVSSRVVKIPKVDSDYFDGEG